MSTIIYFAYGSNMSSRRFLKRVPSANALGTGRLRHHQLAFHKVSWKDGSGKCGIVASDGDEVLGVLFEMAATDKQELDKIEGLGKGYDVKDVEINRDDGNPTTAFTYCATATDPTLKPFTWYLRHVVEGAREAGLPEYYIKKIEKVEAVKDHDCERERKELEIYHN